MRRLLTAAIAVALPACGVSAEPVPSDDVSGTMFVANKRGASLSRIDLATGEETHQADTCENPHELSVSPDGERVMVACYSGSTLEVFLTDDLSRVGEVQLADGARPHAALWLENNSILAGGEGTGTIHLLLSQDELTRRFGTNDGNSLRHFAFGSGQPGAHLLAADLSRNLAWGTIIPNGEVVLYNISTDEFGEISRRHIGNQIEAIALSPDGETLWVSSNADSIAYRLDAETLEVQAEVATGEVPIRLAMHPSGDWVVSSNFGSGDLTVIDTATNEVVRTIPVSGSRDAVQVTLVFSEDGSRLYAAETASDTIAEVDFASGEVLRRIQTGPGGDGLAVMD